MNYHPYLHTMPCQSIKEEPEKEKREDDEQREIEGQRFGHNNGKSPKLIKIRLGARKYMKTKINEIFSIHNVGRTGEAEQGKVPRPAKLLSASISSLVGRELAFEFCAETTISGVESAKKSPFSRPKKPTWGGQSCPRGRRGRQNCEESRSRVSGPFPLPPSAKTNSRDNGNNEIKK